MDRLYRYLIEVAA